MSMSSLGSHSTSCISRSQQRCSTFRPISRGPALHRRHRIQVRAEEGGQGEDAFDKRLAALKSAKKQVPYGKSRREEDNVSEAQPKAAKSYDYRDEQLYWEGPPHRGDLAINIALGTTLLWLPLTFAALGRGIFVNYKFTDRRLTVSTSAPWKTESLDAAYQEIKDVKTVGRGLGFWGDMVVTLRNGDKIELRSLPKFLELRDYILKRREELKSEGSSAQAKSTAKGFA
ncbi:hypothetical protein WJX75_008741 [Coccomyxa subellipsoidea]|uniref:YdbS-like PH domain-containing protein n=1 Tax=Coccomyxa subellipsoidea TaxID=248742 RepID=A0ABR2Z4I9_9CHLO